MTALPYVAIFIALSLIWSAHDTLGQKGKTERRPPLEGAFKLNVFLRGALWVHPGSPRIL